MKKSNITSLWGTWTEMINSATGLSNMGKDYEKSNKQLTESIGNMMSTMEQISTSYQKLAQNMYSDINEMSQQDWSKSSPTEAMQNTYSMLSSWCEDGINTTNQANQTMSQACNQTQQTMSTSLQQATAAMQKQAMEAMQKNDANNWGWDKMMSSTPWSDGKDNKWWNNENSHWWADNTNQWMQTSANWVKETTNATTTPNSSTSSKSTTKKQSASNSGKSKPMGSPTSAKSAPQARSASAKARRTSSRATH